MSTIGFLHTSSVHVPTFEALVAELAPGTMVVDEVAEQLLEIARQSGVADERVGAGIEQRLDGLIDRGAALVVCTCSTIGAVAESVGRQRGVPVVRVDRPMAEMAVDVGGRIAVVAALESTLAPTSELLESVAADRGVDVDLDMHVVPDAWELFESGDQAGYLDAISEALTALAGRCDVIVLAQASMADAADLMYVGIPVLSSPRSAVRALLA
jgi:hypothetical protein